MARPPSAKTRHSEIPPKADDPEQSERFIDTARKLDTDESGEAMEHAFKKAVPSRSRLSKPRGSL